MNPYGRPPVPIEDRFWPKVDASGDCWQWTAGRGARGRYGVVKHGPATRSAHVVAWELLVGPVPDGLELDHLCRNTLCVNPDHLEPVIHAENMRRGLNRMRRHCKRGHPLTSSRYQRRCLTCHNAGSHRARAARGGTG